MNTVELALPEYLTPRERALEITAILATAMVRAFHPNNGQIELGFSAGKSVHTTPSQPGVMP